MNRPTINFRNSLAVLILLNVLLPLVIGFCFGFVFLDLCCMPVDDTGPANCPVPTAPLPVLDIFPTTPADAAALKAHDVHWTNNAIRQHYLKLLNDDSLEFQARRAYVVRHNARLTCRAMMEEAAEVEALRARDLEKYGSTDGPTFDWLVRQQRLRGKCGDEVFRAILESATETDPEVNAHFSKDAAR